MKELVSIIVPAYQAETVIGGCIECLIGQTYKNIEIIIIDDGSRDATLEICREYEKQDTRITCIHIENGGVSNARNTGIAYAKGEYVVFVDSDDTIREDYIEIMINAMKAYNVDLCICSYEYFLDGQSKGVVGNEKSGAYKSNDTEVVATLLLGNMLQPLWNKLYKREFITECFDISLAAGEDVSFNIDYLNNSNTFAVIDEALYSYFSDSKKGIRTLYKRIVFEKFLKFYKKIFAFFENRVSQDTYMNLAEKFINELMGCYLSSLKQNNYNPVMTWKDYKKYNEDIFVQEKVRKLKEYNSKNQWANLIIKNRYFTIMLIQYMKVLRNFVYLHR